MDLMENGYDCDFASDVSKELICVVCNLVLREPVQLGECGHRLCKLCLNQMTSKTSDSNAKLICPVDQEVTDTCQIFCDKAANRSILNLNVYCSYKSQGCLWSGELRNLQEHEEDCPSIINLIPTASSRKLLGKIKNLEKLVKEKDQEVENYKNRVIRLEAVVDTLKTSLTQISNSTNHFKEIFQLKFNVFHSQALKYEWTVSFNELELAQVVSDCFYCNGKLGICFQMSANLLDNSLKVWIRSCRERYNDTSKAIHLSNSDGEFEVCLAGVDGQVYRRSFLFKDISKSGGSFTIEANQDRSIGYGWNEFLKPVSDIKENWMIDSKLHFYCIVK